MDHHETGHRWLCFRLTHTKPVGDFSDNPSQTPSSPLCTLYPLACPTWSNRPLALKSAMPAYRYCNEVVPLKHKLRRMLAKFKLATHSSAKSAPSCPQSPTLNNGFGLTSFRAWRATCVARKNSTQLDCLLLPGSVVLSNQTRTRS
jgi:hypothetical protein